MRVKHTVTMLFVLAGMSVGQTGARCEPAMLERPPCWIPEGVPETVCRRGLDWPTYLENHLLRGVRPEGVERQGPVLRVTLTDGKRVEFEDAYRTEHYRGGGTFPICARCFYYAGRSPSGHHVLAIRLYEGGGHRLLDPDDGSHFDVDGVPAFSPDGKRIAVSVVTYGAPELEVWVRSEDGTWAREWKTAKKEANAGPYGPIVWLSPTSFEDCSGEGGAKVYRLDGTWIADSP